MNARGCAHGHYLKLHTHTHTRSVRIHNIQTYMYTHVYYYTCASQQSRLFLPSLFAGFSFFFYCFWRKTLFDNGDFTRCRYCFFAQIWNKYYIIYNKITLFITRKFRYFLMHGLIYIKPTETINVISLYFLYIEMLSAFCIKLF